MAPGGLHSLPAAAFKFIDCLFIAYFRLIRPRQTPRRNPLLEFRNVLARTAIQPPRHCTHVNIFIATHKKFRINCGEPYTTMRAWHSWTTSSFSWLPRGNHQLLRPATKRVWRLLTASSASNLPNRRHFLLPASGCADCPGPSVWPLCGHLCRPNVAVPPPSPLPFRSDPPSFPNICTSHRLPPCLSSRLLLWRGAARMARGGKGCWVGRQGLPAIPGLQWKCQSTIISLSADTHPAPPRCKICTFGVWPRCLSGLADARRGADLLTLTSFSVVAGTRLSRTQAWGKALA